MQLQPPLSLPLIRLPPRRPAGSGYRWLRLGLAGLLALTLAACAGGAGERRQHAAQLASTAGFTPVRFDGGRFVLQGYLKRLPAAGPGAVPGAVAAPAVLRVYLEGDGLAWLSRTQLSDDPTPLHPTALELALRDPGAAVLYLGRPCQYTEGAERRGCDNSYWSSHRFAPEVIESLGQALDQAKRLSGATSLTLIGYSGGGAAAVLLAERRHDLAALATVAGPIDTGAWVRHHQVTPLTGSLDPVAEIGRLAGLPQVHFVGANDEVVPPAIVRGALERIGPDAVRTLVVVAGADHRCCWADKWGALQQQVPR